MSRTAEQGKGEREDSAGGLSCLMGFRDHGKGPHHEQQEDNDKEGPTLLVAPENC